MSQITMLGVFASNLEYVVIYIGSLKASSKLHNGQLFLKPRNQTADME